jgi:hypothetical protein
MGQGQERRVRSVQQAREQLDLTLEFLRNRLTTYTGADQFSYRSNLS